MSKSVFYERNELLDSVHPVSSAIAVNGAWVEVGDFVEIVVTVQIGLIAATGVFNLDVNQATDATGTGAKNVTDAAGNDVAITALADTDDDVDIVIVIRNEYLDVNGGFNFVRVTATPSVAASLLAFQVYGVRAAQQPVSVTAYQEVISPQ
jgi:hypothetical protein